MIQVVSFATSAGRLLELDKLTLDRHHSSDACMRSGTGVAGMLLRAR